MQTDKELVERLMSHVRYEYMPAEARLALEEAADALASKEEALALAGKTLMQLDVKVAGLDAQLLSVERQALNAAFNIGQGAELSRSDLTRLLNDIAQTARASALQGDADVSR